MFPEYRDLISKLKQEDAHLLVCLTSTMSWTIKSPVWLTTLLPAEPKRLKS